jgi:HSP20 family molecular chaperone IbpA
VVIKLSFWNIRPDEDDLDDDDDLSSHFSVFFRTHSASIRYNSSSIDEILREFDNTESRIEDVMAVEHQFEDIRRGRPKKMLRRDKKTKGKKRRVIGSNYDNNTSSMDDINQFEVIPHNIDDRPVEVIASDKGIKILVEMPLVNKKDIKVNAYDGHVEIQASGSQLGRYQRNIDIPSTVDVRSGKSTYRNGILEIVFDKKRKRSDRKKAAMNN